MSDHQHHHVRKCACGVWTSEEFHGCTPMGQLQQENAKLRAQLAEQARTLETLRALLDALIPLAE